VLFNTGKVVNQVTVLLGTYLAGKMPAPQEFYDSTLYLIFSGKCCIWDSGTFAFTFANLEYTPFLKLKQFQREQALYLDKLHDLVKLQDNLAFLQKS